jgi:DNA repair exonuclease SbcCD ATPase subunit
MKIERIEAINFGKFVKITIIPEQLNSLMGENGMGKTTILNLIRYALTGAEPDGDIIRKGAEECRVTLTLMDSAGDIHAFERIKSRTKASKFRVDYGGNTTAKSMNAKIEEIIGISLDKVDVVSSSDVVAAMKPQEFGSFIMNYIPKKLEIGDVIGFVKTATPGMLSIMEANLPEVDIDVNVIDEFNEFCKANRKELKAQIAAKKLILSEKPTEAPEYDEKELRDRMAALEEEAVKLKTYGTLKSAYDRAVADKTKYVEKIDALKAEADKISGTKPDPDALNKIKKEEDEANDSLRNQETARNAAKTALVQLQRTLEALEKPICPISPLITCHENKTVAKEEVSEGVKSTEEGIVALEAEIEKIKVRIGEIRARRDAEEEKVRDYEKKINMLRQIEDMKKMIPEIPAEPEKPEVEDIDTEKFQITEKLKAIENYKEGVRIALQIESITNEMEDFDKLVKATADKGEIRTGVVSAFLSVFEEVINERSMKHDPRKKFEFIAENGVTVLMNGLKYAELSGGERAYMIFALMDLLNVLSGARLLLLDELSVLDEDTFKNLCHYIMEYISDYDHVLISSVDHPDLQKVVDDLGIKRLVM